MIATLTAIDELATSLLLTDYRSSRPDLLALYERAKKRQWNGTTDLPWEIFVALDRPIVREERLSLYGTPAYDAMTPGMRKRYNVLESAWVVSQCMFGEQASLVGCGQLITILPDMDAKLYVASQAFDEARHAACYRRYLDEKLGVAYAIDENVRYLTDVALRTPEWPLKLVALQTIVESLALGAFKTLLDSAAEPLLVQLLVNIMQDEARHVAFGRLALERTIHDSSAADRARYEDFVGSCVRVMYDGFFPRAVFEELGLPDTAALRTGVAASEQRRIFRHDLFSILIPNVRAVGLLTERSRPTYQALGIDVDAF
ncbi:MAG: diiron oxygenase [Vulcanimicrobiaceae bacterium]